MGKPMAPKYVNLFMDNFEQNLLRDYSKKKMDYHLWYGFVLLTIFSSYGPVTRTRSIISFPSHRVTVNPKNMKSKIKFEIHLTTNEVYFLDVIVSLKHGKLRTTLFTKPTDSHFYLYLILSSITHALKKVPKGQFIRGRRICSRKSVEQWNLV